MLAIKIIGENHFRLDITELGENQLVPVSHYYGTVKRIRNKDEVWEALIKDDRLDSFEHFIGYYASYLACRFAVHTRLSKWIEATRQEVTVNESA